MFTLTDGVGGCRSVPISTAKPQAIMSGESVAMNAAGDTVIIGARVNDDNGANAGQARVFTLTDGGWVQVGADIDGETADDIPARSVAMNAAGDTVIIGAHRNDGNGDVRVMLGCSR